MTQNKKNCPRCIMLERKSGEATELVLGPQGMKLYICKVCMDELEEENKLYEIKEDEGTFRETE